MDALVLAIGADPLGKLQTGALAETLGVSLTLGIQASVAAAAIALVAWLLPAVRRPILDKEARQ